MAFDYFFHSKCVIFSSVLLLFFGFVFFCSFFTTCNKAIVNPNPKIEECYLFGYIPIGFFPRESALFIGLTGLIGMALAIIVLGAICQHHREKEKKTSKTENAK